MAIVSRAPLLLLALAAPLAWSLSCALASFDRNESYGFITDVPLQPVSFAGATNYFTNNVGMFKMVFSIVPAETTARVAAAVICCRR